MFVRIYLRSSTSEQNPKRALAQLEAFVADHNHQVAATYIETASGAYLDRPELQRLLDDSKSGDVILLEQIDRLSRLNQDDWRRLKQKIEAKQLRIVSLDVPTTWQALVASQTPTDTITTAILDAINTMLIELMTTMARKDFEDRQRRQRQGIEAAQKIAGKYVGRRPNLDKHEKVIKYREKGLTLKEVAEATGYSKSQVCKILARQNS